MYSGKAYLFLGSVVESAPRKVVKSLKLYWGLIDTKLGHVKDISYLLVRSHQQYFVTARS